MDLIGKGKELAGKAKKYLTKGTTTDDNKTGEAVRNDFVQAINGFKSELMNSDKLKLDVILGIEPDVSSSIKKADGDDKCIDKLFKKTVMQETASMSKGGLFGGFRVWSEYVFAKLKQAVSKNQAAITKLSSKKFDKAKREKAVRDGVKAVSEAFKGRGVSIIKKLFVSSNSRLKGDADDLINGLCSELDQVVTSSSILEKISENSSPATYKFLNSGN